MYNIFAYCTYIIINTVIFGHLKYLNNYLLQFQPPFGHISLFFMSMTLFTLINKGYIKVTAKNQLQLLPCHSLLCFLVPNDEIFVTRDMLGIYVLFVFLCTDYCSFSAGVLKPVCNKTGWLRYLLSTLLYCCVLIILFIRAEQPVSHPLISTC